MLFLIHYDRKNMKVLDRREYPDSAREQAFRDRLEWEMQFNQKMGDQEIVLLEADNKEQLRKTHPKYVPYTTTEKLFLGVAVVGILVALTG